MTYLKVLWKQSSPDFPVELLSELDDERYEIRKINRYADGHLDIAGPDIEMGDTWLSDRPLPLPETINADPVFSVQPMTSDEFERLWQSIALVIAA